MVSGKINLKINGETMSFEQLTILEILKQLKIEDKTMAVAVNLQVVKKDKWNEFKPQDGDSVEFLNFVGGG